MATELDPEPSDLLRGGASSGQLHRLANRRAQALLWQAGQFNQQGNHDLAATFADAAALVEKGLANDGRRKEREGRALAKTRGVKVPRPPRRFPVDLDEEPRL